MRKVTGIITTCIILCSCAREPELPITKFDCQPATNTINNHTKKDDLQNLIDKYRDKGLPGITLIANSETDGFFEGVTGVADIPTNTPLQFCNLFRVASLTKTFMATAIMQLAENEKVELDAQISSILGNDILDGLEKADETTIDELLNHTSGIANYDDNTRFVASVLNEPEKKLSIEDRLNFAKELKGTPDWVIRKYDQIYSNTNYLLLQLILEKISGKSFEQYLTENIIEPLGLSNTTFSTLNSFPNGLTSGYADFYDHGKLRSVDMFDAYRWSGEAGMISNARDIYTFFKLLMSDQVLSEQTTSLMKANRYGLLRETFEGIEGIGHDGQAIGYSSEMWFFPEKELTIIIIANKGRISADQPSIQIFEALFKEIVSLH